ncbi:MAG: hypothetical protein JSV64_01625 [Candidatus Bathyarchaeota archaeon]|nr:MAG: hypothetical protein JSV64_01625 [Candidatus Bathyarchaeota archaeon]
MTRKHTFIAISLVLLVAVLLISFTLYEILRAPLDPETFQIEPVTWNMTRPVGEGFNIALNENASNSYISDTAVVSFEVMIYSFHARQITDNEHLRMGLNASIIVSEGFVHSIVIRLLSESRNSSLDINEDSDSYSLRNIRIHEIVDHEEESYIDCQAVNKPASCMLRNHCRWNFYDLNTVDHQLSVTLEATYFNGTTYRKAVVPAQLSALRSPLE